MAVNLSIKAVPDSLVEKLRTQAKKNHRSLQGELMTILEENLEGRQVLSPENAVKRLRQVGLKTRSDSTQMIRDDRKRR